MKLPFLDAMRVGIMGRVPVRTFLANVSFTSEPPTNDAVKYEQEYRATCELFFTAIKPKGAEDHVRQEAVDSFTHLLYGEIRRELYAIRQDIFDRDGHAALAKLESLLRDLS